jgi:F-type H+-transporting ATPase subunit beta
MMTATISSATATGRAVRVIGPVVDVEFVAEAVPALFNALKVKVELAGVERTLTLEVAQHLGDNVVRCISMQPPDGMVRGAEVFDTGAAISVPVGPAVKGHVFNALGDCLDDAGDRTEGRRPAHAVRAWWQDRPVRWCRRRQDGAHPGDDQPYRQGAQRYVGVRRRR